MIVTPMITALQAASTSNITIDATVTSPISPYIYGANSPDWDADGVNFPMARLGGNRMTAYNWETNASNAGNDYHFQNDGFMGASNVPGDTLKNFLVGCESHDAAALITIPTAGYVSADKNGDGDVRKTPNYLQTRFFKSLPTKPGPLTYPPDTHDKVVYQDECVAYLENIWNKKTPLWFMLDNEPDLWGSTHAEIWPKNPTYAQIIANNITYASAIKKVAPKALVFGPANYGWNGFHTFQNAPDADGRDFLNTYLAAMKSAGQTAGKRLLDVLDIHWYPEAKGGGVRVTDNGNAATAAARIQAPRSLWDPTYVEDSWIEQSIHNKPIQLLPTIQNQISTYYPGTKFSISEYNYGGGSDISGAIAQADVLGLFGRYGLFAACNWGVGPKDVAELAGFRAFLNYDGKGDKFGNTECAVSGETPDADSAYASISSSNSNRMTIVLINKTAEARNFVCHINGFDARKAKAYEITKDSLAQAAPLSAEIRNGSVVVHAAPYSIITVEADH